MSEAAELLDIAPSGQLTTWTQHGPERFASASRSGTPANLGVEWDEERDVREIRVRYKAGSFRDAAVEYWFKNWPYAPPQMPSFEDPMDDPWQGKWVRASTEERCAGQECSYRFKPLRAQENEDAKNLPDVQYRRTLKIRLLFPGRAPEIQELHVFTGTEQRSAKLRVELAAKDSEARQWSGSISVYNGLLRSIEGWQFNGNDAVEGGKGWQFQSSDTVGGGKWSFRSGRSAKGLLLDVTAAKPDLPGSHDVTVVTVHAICKDGAGENNRSFSFAIDDLKTGPIELPARQARVIDLAASSPNHGVGSPPRKRIRERIPLEPEQTYERATHEIPPLDPWNRESGGRVYLPLAPDSDWQKFAFEYGGDVYVSKTGIKAKGRELERLKWKDDRITWRLATGTDPHDRVGQNVRVDKLDGFLPVVTQRWQKDGIAYSEEAYSTLLRGDLAPKNRDEGTPALLMLKLTAQNGAADTVRAHVQLNIDAGFRVILDGSVIKADGNVVAYLDAPKDAHVEGGKDQKTVDISFTLSPGGKATAVFKLPCVSDLSLSDVKTLAQLDYDAERARIIDYWRHIVEPAVRFHVPEPKFELLAKSVIAQIHISTTKDPKTGLYMVPAASYVYDVFENESCYQVLLLDTLGQFETAADYLEAMLRLQGSKNFPGAQTGSTEGIFHGVKIDSTYDYTASGYGLDHGTVLWTLAQHYFYSRDRGWLEHAWPHMQKAIDWIERERATTKRTDVHGEKLREYGLLPASQLEDNADWANWFSINAFAWAGMHRTAEALADAGNPQAAKVRQEADAYRQDLRTAVLRAVESAPVVRMQDGVYEPYVPVLPTRRFRLFGPIRADYYQRYGHPDIKPLMRLAADRDTLCGAVLLVLLGVFSPDEPIANWILNDWEDNETLSSGMGMNIHGMTDDRYWFSQGGMVFQANLVNPIQVYLLRHETGAAIRNLYNDFVACLYPEVTIFTEEFHQWIHGSGPFYKISDESRFVNRVRDMLVFEDKDTLWLAPGTPGRWLTAKEGVSVDRVETFFGPVSYRMHAGSEPGVIEATVQLPSRNPAKTVWLVARVPEKKIQSVSINEKPWKDVDPKLEAIKLPQAPGSSLRVEVRYQ